MKKLNERHQKDCGHLNASSSSSIPKRVNQEVRVHLQVEVFNLVVSASISSYFHLKKGETCLPFSYCIFVCIMHEICISFHCVHLYLQVIIVFIFLVGQTSLEMKEVDVFLPGKMVCIHLIRVTCKYVASHFVSTPYIDETVKKKIRISYNIYTYFQFIQVPKE